MGDEHLDTIPSTENLVPIPSELEGISDDTCDMLVGKDSSTFDALSDHYEILFDSNNDGTSSNDDSFENIEYVEASPLNLEIVSLEEVNKDQEEKDPNLYSDEANEKDDSTSGTKIPINPVPVATKSPSIANYKIIKQGRKGVYQIVRENGTDMVYISFGAMLTDISRDDLTELYRIVMKKHGMNEPEDEFEKVLWEYLKNMFEEPLSTDSIWSLPGQQRIICWRYYDACRVHCLNLESADVYMLIERKYPLSAEVCKAMLDKKLQGGKPDEDCYKLLKMMEKQAGAKGLTSPEQTATVEMVFSQPWTCTFLVAKGLTTPELMANWKIIMLQFKNNSKDNAHKILKKLIMKTLKET
ncbi:hypothetical protein Tco_1541118 [Tanacetum coccineum]